MKRQSTMLLLVFLLTLAVSTMVLVVPQLMSSAQAGVNENAMLNSELTILRSKLENVQVQLSTAESEMAAVEEENDQLKTANAVYMESLENSAEEITALETQLKESPSNALLIEKEEEIEALKEQMAVLEETKTEMEGQMKDQGDSVYSHEEFTILQAENEDLNREIDDLMASLDSYIQKYNRLASGYSIADWNRYIEPNEVIGTWEVVNVLDDTSYFDVNNLGYISSSNYISRMLFYANGNAVMEWKEGYEYQATWLDDAFMDEDAPWEFLIDTIEGNDYMFLELKNGDYFRGDDLGYYVFKKVD